MRLSVLGPLPALVLLLLPRGPMMPIAPTLKDGTSGYGVILPFLAAAS